MDTTAKEVVYAKFKIAQEAREKWDLEKKSVASRVYRSGQDYDWGVASSEFEIYDDAEKGTEYQFVCVKLNWEMCDGEIYWETRWPHCIGYLATELKPCIDQYCPAPKEVWETFLDSLPASIREKFEQPSQNE